MRRKTGKKILRRASASIAVLGCLVITVTIGGCGWMKKILPESAKDKALEYLNTKYSTYGDIFTPVLFTPSDWSDPDATVTFKSKKYNDQIVTVFIHSDKKDSYSDDYFHLYMAEEVEQYFINVAKEHGINAKPSVTFTYSGVGEEVEAETTFEEYINDGLGHMCCYYVVTDPVEASQAKTLIEDISTRGIYGMVHIYLCTSEEDVEAIIADEAFDSEKVTRLYRGRIRLDGTVTIE